MAVSSEVQICNLALSRIGDGTTIQSRTEESAQAIACNLVYDKARDSLLRDIDPGFARRVTTLALTGTAPDYWTYSYAMPTDALAIRFIYSEAYQRFSRDEQAYEVASNASGQPIWTDIQFARAAYTASISDTIFFDEAFTDALILRVAADIAMPITSDQPTRDNVVREYLAAVSRAKAQNMRESYEDYTRWTASQIEARS